MKQITVNNEVAYKIKNYTGYYITKTGIIYSVKALGKNGMIDYTNPHKLKYKKDKYGYFKVFLSNDGITKEYSVHRLVTLQFIGRIPKNKQVNHIDGNKLNNNVTNLEIVTPKENTIHAHKNHLTSTECPVNVIYENKEYKFNSKTECMNYFKDISGHYLKQLQENIIIPSMILFERIYDENNKQKIKTYYNGQFLKEFSMMKDAEIYFNMKRGTVSAIIKSDNQEYRRKINKYIISFTNVSTIENTSIDGSK